MLKLQLGYHLLIMLLESGGGIRRHPSVNDGVLIHVAIFMTHVLESIKVDVLGLLVLMNSRLAHCNTKVPFHCIFPLVDR